MLISNYREALRSGTLTARDSLRRRFSPVIARAKGLDSLGREHAPFIGGFDGGVANDALMIVEGGLDAAQDEGLEPLQAMVGEGGEGQEKLQRGHTQRLGGW